MFAVWPCDSQGKKSYFHWLPGDDTSSSARGVPQRSDPGGVSQAAGVVYRKRQIN